MVFEYALQSKTSVLVVFLVLAVCGVLILKVDTNNRSTVRRSFPPSYNWKDQGTTPFTNILDGGDISLRPNMMRAWISQATARGHASGSLSTRSISQPRPIGVGHTEVQGKFIYYREIRVLIKYLLN